MNGALLNSKSVAYILSWCVDIAFWRFFRVYVIRILVYLGLGVASRTCKSRMSMKAMDIQTLLWLFSRQYRPSFFFFPAHPFTLLDSIALLLPWTSVDESEVTEVVLRICQGRQPDFGLRHHYSPIKEKEWSFSLCQENWTLYSTLHSYSFIFIPLSLTLVQLQTIVSASYHSIEYSCDKRQPFSPKKTREVYLPSDNQTVGSTSHIPPCFVHLVSPSPIHLQKSDDRFPCTITWSGFHATRGITSRWR